MKIAILGATSQIAKDLILSFRAHSEYELVLFSRAPQKVLEQFEALSTKIDYENLSYDGFSSIDNYDVIINFVGVGDPAVAKQMGARIFDITDYYDKLVLDYLVDHPNTKYIFLSSGAVFGGTFEQPVTENSISQINLNNLQDSDWYGIAKIYAEARHRALKNYAIVDVRVFNYFSHTQDMNARFLITDIVRSIQTQTELKTATDNIVRDFITPKDFFTLISRMVQSESVNFAVDCYTQAPIDKLSLLKSLQEKFGLRYELVASAGLNATGAKINYYSTNKRASQLGYLPQMNSQDGLIDELAMLFK